MGLLVEGTLFAAGLVLTVVVGAPLASRAATQNGAWAWLRRAHQDTPERPRVEMTRAFTPLDLGPDPIQWPSQRPWPESPLVSPPWPSQTWNDEHFGAFWRNQPGHAHARPQPPAASSSRDAEAAFFQQSTPVGAARDAAPGGLGPGTRAPAPGNGSRDREPAVSAAQVRQAAANAKGSKPQQARPKRQAATPAAPTAPKAAPTRPVAPASAAPATGSAARGQDVPTREELEAMVTEIGLAGTVQRIMERTGWDFRQSAQYLARIRQGG